MTPFLLGVDVGTSGCKVTAVDARGNILGAASQSYATHYPRPGWAVQHPHDWYGVACQAVRECLAHNDLRPSDVLGLSVDGPAHSAALLDAAGEVLYPTIHTSDVRSVPQTEWLERQHGPRVLQISYQRPNPSWTLSHLLWLKACEPDVWHRLKRILVVKDYVRAQFVGDYATDRYDAIGTQLYDVAADDWSDELCDLAGLPTHLLPQVRPAFDVAGPLIAAAAHDLGLNTGTPVAVGSGDSVVEAFGVGAALPGQATVKLATAANVNIVAAALQPSRDLITYRHVVGEHWFSIAATNAGAASLRWFREQVLRMDNVEAVEPLAAQAPAGCEGLLFHPYLLGERTPHWDPQLRGDFIGIGMRHGLAHFARAVLEGVAFSLRDCLCASEAQSRVARELRVIGGGAKIGLWRRILCDVLGRPLLKPRVEDASFGAALLAGVAVGVFSSVDEALRSCAAIDEVMEPDMAAHAFYSALYEVYVAVARDLARHNHRLVELVMT